MYTYVSIYIYNVDFLMSPKMAVLSLAQKQGNLH